MSEGADSQDVGLTDVRHARAAVIEVEERMVAAVRAALAAGESVASVADAAGVTRQTIYRWRDRELKQTPVAVSAGTRRTLDDALTAMLQVGVGPAATADLASALAHRDLHVKALRIDRGVRALTVPMRDVPAEESRQIRHGQLAATAVLAARAAGRDLPTKIRIDS